jgi:hypothetical protein
MYGMANEGHPGCVPRPRSAAGRGATSPLFRFYQSAFRVRAAEPLMRSRTDAVRVLAATGRRVARPPDTARPASACAAGGDDLAYRLFQCVRGVRARALDLGVRLGDHLKRDGHAVRGPAS